MDGRPRLERQGIVVDDLLEEFVTCQAVRTYLMEEREAEYEYDSATAEEEAESVRQLAGRVSTVGETEIEQLRTREDITLGEFRMLVDITVIYEDCGKHVGPRGLSDVVPVPVSNRSTSTHPGGDVCSPAVSTYPPAERRRRSHRLRGHVYGGTYWGTPLSVDASVGTWGATGQAPAVPAGWRHHHE